MDERNAPQGGLFEVKINGVTRALRDIKESAIYAARLLQQRNPGAEIVIIDLRDGSEIQFDEPAK